VNRTLDKFLGDVIKHDHAEVIEISGKSNNTFSIVAANSADWGFSGYIALSGDIAQNVTGTKTFTNLIQQNGRDSTSGDGFNTQENGFRANVIGDYDSNFIHALSGEDKWMMETFRNEAAEYWYLYNNNAQREILTISESGRFSVNQLSNIMDYHTIYAGGPADGGYDDLEIGGEFNGITRTWYNVRIFTVGGTVDQFRMMKSVDDKVNWTSYGPLTDCSLTPIELEYGITLKFDNLTGHTTGNSWDFLASAADPMGTTSIAPMKFDEILTTLDYNGNTFKDYTASLSNSTVNFSTGKVLIPASTPNGAFYIGAKSKFAGAYITIRDVASNCTLIADYWSVTANDWLPLSIIDGTNPITGANSLRQSGLVYWNKPLDWGKNTIPGEHNLYWIRFRSSTALSSSGSAKAICRNTDKVLAVYAAPMDFSPSCCVDCRGNTVLGQSSGVSNKILTVSDVRNPSSQAGGQGISVVFAAGGGIYMKDNNTGCEGKYESFGGTLQVGTMTQHDTMLYSGDMPRVHIPHAANVEGTLNTINSIVAAESNFGGNMAAGFGAATDFAVQAYHNYTTQFSIASIGAVLPASYSGTGPISGDMVFKTLNAGSMTEKMRITAAGNILKGSNPINALITLNSVPAINEPGRKGDIGYYSGYVYIWTDDNVVVRSAAETSW